MIDILSYSAFRRAGFRRIGYTVAPALAKFTPSLLRGEAKVAVYVYDTFTDADGASLDAHTPDIDLAGGGWSEALADWAITDNRGHQDNSAISCAVIDAAAADVKISMGGANTATNPTARETGVVLRYSDWLNYWVVGWNQYANLFRISERVNGTETVRASSVISGDTAEHTVEAAANGATIQATYDGVNDIAYSSATFNQAKTEHGVRCFRRYGDGAYVDEFKVEAP